MSTFARRPSPATSSVLGALDGKEWCRPTEGGVCEHLDTKQREITAAFLKAAREQAAVARIELLFRGETRARLGKRLCCNESAALAKVAAGLFYFGEKGKHFWTAGLRRSQEESGQEWDTLVKSIADSSPETFGRLLCCLRNMIELSAARRFREQNTELCKDIRTGGTAEQLIQRFSGLSDTDKRWVRDVFIYVVHTFSRQEHKTYTPFVSTSPDFERAKYFAKRGAKDTADPCVIYLWLPSGREDRVLRSSNLSSASRKLVALGFPPIRTAFFNENEVALFGGIFPHFVFAAMDLDGRTALFNPGLFAVDVSESSAFWRVGFPIDQSDFEQRLGTTGYAKGLERSASGEREIKPC